jgi:4-amino-4-deoxy-L-arabinose transferase-like glycosyltransferase
MKLTSFFRNIKKNLPREVFLVFLLAFVVRLFAANYTYIVNQDGVLYIHQARAIFYGEWENLKTCILPYISNYPIFVAGAFAIFRDWIVAARSISILFGTITLIPLYLLLKRFFEDKINFLVVLMYALTPVLVGRSADVVRGPVYWFFISWGLYFFVRQISKRNFWFLIFSNLSFLMATWARIEGLLFIFVSCFFLLAVEKDQKLKKFSFFILPLILIFIISVSGAIVAGFSVGDFYQGYRIILSFADPISHYVRHQEVLKVVAETSGDDFAGFFIRDAANLMWFLCLGVLFFTVLETFFYPFVPVFAIGLGGIWNKIKSDRRVLYLCMLIVAGFLLLYANLLQLWFIYNRMMLMVVIPSCVFAGFGLEKLIRFFHSKWRVTEVMACSILCLLIMLSAFSIDLRTREADKSVFSEIGENIAIREGNDTITIVSTSLALLRWIPFYANLRFRGGPCPQDGGYSWEFLPDEYGPFVEELKKKQVKYFLWDEKRWPVEKFDVHDSEYRQGLREIGRWYHRDTGQMILFEVI